MKKTALYLFFIFHIVVWNCSDNRMENKIEMKNQTDLKVTFAQLAHKKIFFGHQSVGNNIMNGVDILLREASGVPLNIKETRNPEDFKNPVFAHAKIGTNKDPLSKIQDFQSAMQSSIGDKAEIAFFKFCYIDIVAETDVDHVFSAYKQVMTELANTYKNTRFFHVTVPLRTVQTGFRAQIKNQIGRPIGEYAENIKRNRFNEKMRQEFANDGTVFDLAKIESTYAEGNRFLFEKDGNEYEALIPEYTEDGGHLNTLGQKIVAMEFINFLANVPIHFLPGE